MGSIRSMTRAASPLLVASAALLAGCGGAGDDTVKDLDSLPQGLESAGEAATALERAQAVGNYLGNRRVDPQRMIMTGAGASHPVASNGTEAGRAENRRVEITIVPLRS